MIKTKKRLISMWTALLALVAAALIIPATTASAADVWDGSVAIDFAGGAGTNTDPYLIENGEQLALLADMVNAGDTTYNAACYTLTADIVLNDSLDGASQEWTPIGTESNPFQGTFDGKKSGGGNYTVKGVYISNGGDNCGLFGYIDNASVMNVGVIDSSITGGNNVGGLCGCNCEGTITECYNTGEVIGTGDNVGGVCGENSSGLITDCYNAGNVEGENNVGGVCGSLVSSHGTPKIINCFSINNVSGTGEVGGVCGNNDGGKVTYSYYNSDLFTADNGLGEGLSTLEMTCGEALENMHLDKRVWVKTDNDKTLCNAYYPAFSEDSAAETGYETELSIALHENCSPVYRGDVKLSVSALVKFDSMTEFSADDPVLASGEGTFKIKCDNNYITTTDFGIPDNTKAEYLYKNGDIGAGEHTFTLVYSGSGSDYLSDDTAAVDVTIAKADFSGTLSPISKSNAWNENGAFDVDIAAVLPEDFGKIKSAAATITGDSGIVSAAGFSNGKFSYTLAQNATTDIGKTAVITYTVTTQNYNDIDVAVNVTLTDKKAQTEKLKCTLVLSVENDNTYTATIAAIEGAEYSFDGKTWSNVNTLSGIAHATTVTAYIRYAETDTYNAGEAVSESKTTAHGILTHHAAKAASCTEEGNNEYWTCDLCKLYFSDKNGTNGITQAQTVIAKTTHKWAEKYECDKDGHWQKCKACGATTNKEKHVSDGAATVDSAEVCEVCDYEIAPKLEQAATPAITPKSGRFTDSQVVTITCTTKGATIYYTTDGKTPTAKSTKYSKPFTLTDTATVKAIAIKDGMGDSKVASATFTKKSSGSSGGDSGSSDPTTPTEPKPSLDSSSMSWSDIAAKLAKRAIGSEVTIGLNGITTVPAEVIKAIDERELKATFVVDSAKSWKIDGANITSASSADLSFQTSSSLKTSTLRGTSGIQFTINNTKIPTDLAVTFKSSNAGKFANLYKSVNGKLTFVSCTKIGAGGKVILPDVSDKGNYVAMLCDFSDLRGDMNNDGETNVIDASDILKEIVGLEKGANPLMADYNSDGKTNAKDASDILKSIIGLS